MSYKTVSKHKETSLSESKFLTKIHSMNRLKFKTSKKLKTIHLQMIVSLGVEKIRYEYENYYFFIKIEKIEKIEAHFKKIGIVLLKIKLVGFYHYRLE